MKSALFLFHQDYLLLLLLVSYNNLLFPAEGFLKPVTVTVINRAFRQHKQLQYISGFPSLVSLTRLSESDKDTQPIDNDRSQGLRRALSALGEVSESEIKVGSTVVAGNNIPNLGIWQFQAYELKSIYDQGTKEDGVVEKIQRASLEEPVQPPTYTRYVTLYSKKHHEDGQPVVVSPQEVELSSMQQEVVSSLLQALPLFVFWTALAFSFANQYSQRTGGTFWDAMFGR